MLLFDAHHLGLRQTGNETWTRNLVRAMQGLLEAGEMEYAVTTTGLEELSRLTSGRVHLVSTSSTRRLLVDLPRAARAAGAGALLVTYTAPPTPRPAVVLVHDVSAWHPAARDWLPLATRLQYRTTVGLSCRRAAHVIASSQATRQDLIEKVGVAPDRVCVAGGAVDPEFRSLLAAATSRTPDGVFRVLAVGNVVPRKNLLLLARAVAACRAEGCPAQLVIVGSIPGSGQAIAGAIARLLGGSVHITGYVSEADLALQYRAADVVCVPSLLEGFGLPVLEAMAAGVPVLVSDTSSLPGVAGDGALVLGAHSLAAWRDALLRLHGDAGLREELRRRGARRAAQLSWADTAAIVLDRLRAADRRRTTHRRDERL